jgi:hypothetical protein
MSDTVTRQEFDALEVRVAALEEEIGIPEPGPVPPDPVPPGEGIQAKRIVDLIERFGVNTFSSMDEHNSWGSWPADYSPPSTVAALKYLVGDSGFTLSLREYHYAGRYDMQKQWFAAILTELPDTRFTVCPGANASAADVPTMLRLPHTWVEGLNEPNTDFGSGEVPFETTLSIQQTILDARAENIMGPSIVAGTPHPEGWITGYCKTPENLATLNALFSLGNGHYYPPASPDVPGTGYSINEYVGGLWSVYAQHLIHLTEFHPTLYNARGYKPDQKGWDGHRDAYYTLCTWLRCAQNGTQGLWWYALFDYGTVYKCGLFPQKYANDPRPAATAIRNLCTICTDKGDRRGFIPGVLNVKITGLTDATDLDVYQASDGRYLIPVWHAAEELGQGDAVWITLDFGTPMERVSMYNPLDSAGPVDTLHAVRQMTFGLPPGVIVLEVHL